MNIALWSRWSIAVKLPLTLALLLLVLGVAMGVVSYLEVRRTVLGIASERLAQGASQMATVLGTSARQRLAAMQQLKDRPELATLLRTGDAAAAEAVTELARSHLGPAIKLGSVELWNAAGMPLLAIGEALGDLTTETRADCLNELQSTQAVVGRFRLDDRGLLYPVGARLVDGNTTLGYVVEWRRVSAGTQTRQTMDLLAGFIGSNAAIVVGNSDGSAWSDLLKPVAGLPIHNGDTDIDRLWDYERPGVAPVLARATRIDATPWLVAAEFPRDEVMAPADRLIRRASAMAVVLLLVATLIGWGFSRRITSPLRQVTEAAVAVAEGQHVNTLDIDRQDEIGRLAGSFNAMAANVERARTELEQRVSARTAELSAVNRELESFSYSVSHDLRAPLRAIAGFVQILEEDHGDRFNVDARRSLDRVKANASRMGQLIDELLSFARIGRLPVSRQRVDVNHLARTAADEAIAAAAHPIELVIEPLPPCLGEPALLKQVFANLLSNAVKFTARTAGARVVIGAEPGDETVYFVRDNGAGFDERYAEKLFGVFQRLHRTAEFEGTGVGLAIVQRIIARHGGRIWAQGRVNAGATFFFTLPPSSAATAAAHTAGSAPVADGAENLDGKQTESTHQ